MYRQLSGLEVTFFITLFCVARLIIAQSSDSRCFQFTWLGPRYNNGSEFMNATCEEATRLAEGVPCRLPLVASYDGSWPDVGYIYQHYRDEATCLLASNDVCAKYTYYYDGVAENATYMCTRAVTSEGAAITRGCYEQRNGTFVTRVCFCTSIQGAMPCNDAPFITLAPVVVFTVIAFLLKDCYKNLNK